MLSNNTKKCTKCNVEKQLTDFQKSNRTKDGFSNSCKECKNKHNRDLYYKKAIENDNNQQDFKLIIKVCNKCGVEKDGTCFNKHKSKPDGLTTICKECRSKYLRDKRKENPEYRDNINKKTRDKANARKDNFDNSKSKVCTKCGIEKTLDLFVKEPLCIDGTKNICNECKNKRHNELLNSNPERRARYIKQRRDKINSDIEYKKSIRKKEREKLKNNPEYHEKCKQRQRGYRLTPNAIKARKIRESKPEFKVAKVMRRLIDRIMKYKDDNFKNKELGYTKHELMNHLEKQFDNTMSWENYGDWHVDHIIPVSKFDKSVPSYIINHLENLQPLDGIENLSKNNRIDLLPEITIGEYVLILNESEKYEIKKPTEINQ